MHGFKLVYRDLKPENVVLDADGNVKMIDFQMAKSVPGRTFTTCGTPEYMAPEMITGQGYTYYVDYWAFGILIYDILIGKTPFQEQHFSNSDTFQAIISRPLQFPSNYPVNEMTELISLLLRKKVSKRLGCTGAGAQAIKQHRFFTAVDWKKLVKMQWPNCGMDNSPFVMDPQTKKDAMDSSSFTNIDLEEPLIPYTPSGATYEKLWDTEFV